MSIFHSKRKVIFSFLIFLIPFIVYISSLLPSVGYGDSAEFQTLSHTFGVAHCTGYPLYILIGKLFTFIPIYDIAYRVNLMSAFFAAMTVMILYNIFLYLKISFLSSVIASLSFAFCYAFWAEAIWAEVYTLNTFFLSLIIFLLIKWSNDKKPSLLYLIALCCGLSFGNHLATMVIIAPALCFYILYVAISNKLWDFKIFLKAFLIFLSCIALEAFCVYWWHKGDYPIDYFTHIENMPIRYQLDRANFSKFYHKYLWLIMGKEGGSKMFSLPFIQIAKNLVVFLISFAKYFSFIGVFLGILGIFINMKKIPKLFWLLSLMFLSLTVMSLNYAEFRIQVFFIPIYMIFSFWLAWGIDEFLGYNWLSKYKTKKYFKLIFVVVMILFIVYPQYALTNILEKYPPVNKKGKIIHLLTSPHPFKFRNNYEEYNYGKEILESVEKKSIIFATWTALCILKYFQYVEKYREDVIIYHNWREDILEIIEENIDKRNIYFTDYVKKDYLELIDSIRNKLLSSYKFINCKDANLIKIEIPSK